MLKKLEAIAEYFDVDVDDIVEVDTSGEVFIVQDEEYRVIDLSGEFGYNYAIFCNGIFCED